MIRVVQHGYAACHMGYRSCYYRRLWPDNTYEIVDQRLFDPEIIYSGVQAAPIPAEDRFLVATGYTHQQARRKLEGDLRQLYAVYLYLRDNDMSEESNTSRLLHERSHSHLVARLADELQELADVQSGEHVHTSRKEDTILEASQVGYWLLLLAATANLSYEDFAPHASVLSGYTEQYGEGRAIEQRQDCLSMFEANTSDTLVQGLHLGFALIGWACTEAGVSPLAPAEFDLEQMHRKGLVK